MIVFIDGVVINKALDRVTINVNGLGYECYISSTTFDSLPKEGKLVSLHTYLSISENNHTLFAFSSLPIGTSSNAKFGIICSKSSSFF